MHLAALFARAAALVVVLFALFPVHGQQHSFTQLSTKDGLAQSQVRCMAQDAEGYLWFGTLGGASRYDGHDFVNHACRKVCPMRT
jgi:ligand-binding sensor domain-containing protein